MGKTPLRNSLEILYPCTHSRQIPQIVRGDNERLESLKPFLFYLALLSLKKSNLLWCLCQVALPPPSLPRPPPFQCDRLVPKSWESAASNPQLLNYWHDSWPRECGVSVWGKKPHVWGMRSWTYRWAQFCKLCCTFLTSAIKQQMPREHKSGVLHSMYKNIL